ncbi:MAG TPA: hypothetical protein HPP66_09465 [Planctomycetes bacterium]|nr:hypothetical protein [Planctomycetota bacterium]
MSIENQTLAHFRHFSSLFTNFSSTTVVSALQIAHFMQNKPNFQKVKMNVSRVSTKDYAKWTLGQRGKNKPNSNPKQTQSNPIKANKMPKQTQYKPKQTQFHLRPNTSPAHFACFYPQNRLISESRGQGNLTELYDNKVTKGDKNASSRFS